MDLSKAFDLVEWYEMFSTLQKRNISPIFLRLLLFIYKNQYCYVKWNTSYSHSQTGCIELTTSLQCVYHTSAPQVWP